jgi:hypothetical protein
MDEGWRRWGESFGDGLRGRTNKGAHKERVAGGIDGKGIRAERRESLVVQDMRGGKEGRKNSGEKAGDEPMRLGENLGTRGGDDERKERLVESWFGRVRAVARAPTVREEG